MKSLRIAIRIQFCLAVILFHPQLASAQWIPDGIPVCTENEDQLYVDIVSDGVGGVIMAWEDRQFSSNHNIYAQRVDGAGNALWATNGIPICTATRHQESPKIVPDGSGGAIIAWTDHRFGSSQWIAVYAQRVDAAGAVLWAADGVYAAYTKYQAGDWAIASNGSGGAVFSWQQFDAGPGYVIRAQRVDASGARVCPCDVVICSDPTGIRSQVNMASDGAAGAIIVWNDRRSPLDGIYAQRFDAAGTVRWTANGVAVCTTAVAQSIPVIVPITFNGVVIAWQDLRNDAGDIYAQKLGVHGDPIWTTDGVSISSAANEQMNIDMVHDGSGGAFLTWEDARVDTNIYAQHVDNLGTDQWTTNGLAVCTAPKWQLSPRIVASNSYEAIITWEDRRDVPHLAWKGDIYAQRVTDSGGGGVWWTTDGIPICTASGGQESPVITTDGSSGAIIAWTDGRNGLSTGGDIYAQRTYYDACALVPTSFQFGEIQLGSYSDQSFEIVAGAVLSGEVTETCDDFDIVSGGGPFTLAPGESHEVTVRFEPTTIGDQSCYADMGDDLCRASMLWRGTGCPGSVVYVDADAGGTGDGSSWGNAVNELRDAYVLLDVCNGITEIWVAEGTYLPAAGSDRGVSFELGNGLAIYGGFDGTETSLGQRDVAAHPTILSGDLGATTKSDNSYHVVDGSNVTATAVLDGFTGFGGYADGTGDDQYGAGLFVKNGSPTVSNVTFSRNLAVGNGGGMYNEAGSPSLTDVTFEQNASEGGFGGGLTNWSGDPTITQAVFRANSASGGGGMYTGGGNPTLTNVHFEDNSVSVWGGGFYANGNATLVNGVFRNNSADMGGGVFNFFNLSGTYNNVTFSGNSASNSGGAMHSLRSVPTLTNVIMWGNTAPLNPETGYADGTPVISYSLIQGCGGSGIGWNPTIGNDGGNNIDADPWLKGDDWPDTPLAVYSCSPAINAGDNSAVPGGVTTDIEGNPRISGGTVDMGAYEYQAPKTGVEDDTDSNLPTVTAIKGAYPNPFNPTVTVEFDLDRRRNVEVSIYDVQGRLVRNLVNENRNRGTHRVRWEGRDNRGNQVASGIYLLLVRSEGWSDHRKIVLLK